MNAILTPRMADVLAASDESLEPIFGRGEPGVFESMGMTPVSASSLSIRTAPTPQEPSSISGGGDTAGFRCITPHCPELCGGCTRAIPRSNEAAVLMADVLNAFARDGHGGVIEDGESELVDKAREWLNRPAQRGIGEHELLELVTVGAMHKCRSNALFSQCVNCGAMAEELAKPCKSFMSEARHAFAAAFPSPSLGSDAQNPRFTMQEWEAHARKHRWRFDLEGPADGPATEASLTPTIEAAP